MYLAGEWQAMIVVPDDYLEALREAAPDWLAPERYAFVTELFSDGSDGPTQLDFRVDASNDDDVAQVARGEWNRLLDIAQLERVNPQFAGYLPPSYEARYAELRAEADRWMAAERYDLAVLRAQTACEVLARVAVAGAFRAELGRGRGDAMAVLVKPALTDRSSQTALAVLGGARVNQQSWWRDYVSHLARRNQVAHAGARPMRADAEASLAAVDACMTWLKDLWAGRFQPEA